MEGAEEVKVRGRMEQPAVHQFASRRLRRIEASAG